MLNESLNISDYAQRQIEGKITLELLDARTGKLREKVDTSNFVAVPAISHLQWKQREVIKSGISTLNSALDEDVKPQPVFNGLFLSDDSGEGSPVSDITIPGNLIGFADKNAYSGSNTLRGSVNIGLSEATSAYTKWVFDWPTHAANGTINSVGWTNMQVSPTYPYALTSGTYTRLSDSVIGRYIARVSDDLIFTSQYGTTADVQKYDSEMNLTGTITALTFMQGIAWDTVNEWLWVIRSNQLIAYNADGATMATLTVTNRNYRGLTFDGENLWTTEGIGTTAKLYEISTQDGSDVSSVDIPLDQNTFGNLYESPTGLCWDTSRNCFWVMTNTSADGSGWENYAVQCRLVQADSSGIKNAISYATYAWGSLAGGNIGSWRPSSPTYLGDVDFIDESNLMMSQGVTGTTSINVSRYNLNSLGSRAKLPSTIAKTSGQTMRVTYQMNYS